MTSQLGDFKPMVIAHAMLFFYKVSKLCEGMIQYLRFLCDTLTQASRKPRPDSDDKCNTFLS